MSRYHAFATQAELHGRQAAFEARDAAEDAARGPRRPQVAWTREDNPDAFEAHASATAAADALRQWEGVHDEMRHLLAALGAVRRAVHHAFAARGLPVPEETRTWKL